MADEQDRKGESTAGLEPMTGVMSSGGNSFSVTVPVSTTSSTSKGGVSKTRLMTYEGYCMQRMFFPVGQGAFYCERFHAPGRHRFTVVYDCGVLGLPKKGSRKRPNLWDNFSLVLKRHFPKTLKTINALYISHLDSDHVNGLRVLRQHGIKIKKFFLPGIDERDRWLRDLWYETMDPDGPAWAIFRDPSILSVMFPGAEVVVVPSAQLERDPSPVSNSNTIKLADAAPVFATTPFSDWMFSPFNLRRDEYIDTLQDALADVLQLSKPVSNEVLREQWEQKGQDILEDVIKDAYEKALSKYGPGTKFNTNSMTLFSGPTGGALCQKVVPCGAESCQLASSLSGLLPGGLYTGDYDAKYHMTDLQRHYSAFWGNIGCIQIPHHGADGSFNSRLLQHNAVFVASAGSKNKYKHPSTGVVKSFKSGKKHLFCVTEQQDKCLCTLVFPRSKPMDIVTCAEAEKRLCFLGRVLPEMRGHNA